MRILRYLHMRTCVRIYAVLGTPVLHCILGRISPATFLQLKNSIRYGEIWTLHLLSTSLTRYFYQYFSRLIKTFDLQ